MQIDASTAIRALVEEVRRLQTYSRAQEMAPGCECSGDDQCAFAKRTESAEAELARLRSHGHELGVAVADAADELDVVRASLREAVEVINSLIVPREPWMEEYEQDTRMSTFRALNFGTHKRATDFLSKLEKTND